MIESSSNMFEIYLSSPVQCAVSLEKKKAASLSFSHLCVRAGVLRACVACICIVNLSSGVGLLMRILN
jgi:hypothetical protein